MRNGGSGAWALAVLLIGSGLVGGAPVAPATEAAPQVLMTPALRSAVAAGVGRGLGFLAGSQREDGSWEGNVGITGLAVVAFLRAPEASRPKDSGARIDRALAYIAGKAKEDGGLYERDTPNYNTAVGLRALALSGKPEYRPLVEKAQAFLVRLQADEGEGYEEKEKFYGGIGYGGDLRPDLANMEMALSGLKESGMAADAAVFAKALKFVQRTQNSSETNDMEWAGNDGGFVYYPGFSYSGVRGSYGSMTYAGLMSYAYAEVAKDDPRVQSALKWIRANYTVDDNPGLKATALYYYYFVFAKALRAYGEDLVVDGDGVKHSWREDLGTKLLALQKPEGFWINEVDPQYMQDNKPLVTAFVLDALENVLAE